MEVITRTGYGAHLQTCMKFRRPYPIYTNTTLNEKLNIQSGVKPPVGEYPYCGYLAIGNGGHKVAQGADNMSAPDPVEHIATDAAPFKILPFVLREQTDDLSEPQRRKYALRREEEHNGVRYYAYYLMRMDLSALNPTLELVVVDGDTKTTSPFVPTSEVLSPVPQELSPTGVNTVDGDYLSASAKVPIVFTEDDMTELRNVAKVLFGADKYAIISELIPCYGYDKMVDSPAPGNTTIPFNEAIAVQVDSFINTFIAAKFTKSGFDMLLDAGTSEPLFKLTAP